MKKIVLSAFGFAALFGFEFQPVGIESISMGGAGVARAKGDIAAYYNPALLAENKRYLKVYVGALVGGREINLANSIDRLANKYELSQTIDTIKEHAPISGSNDEKTKSNIKGAIKELYRLSNGNGLELQPGVLFSTQIKNFSIGAYALSDLRAKAIIDRDHLYLIFKDDKDGGYYYYYPDTDTYGATDSETYKKYSLEYAIDNKLTYLDVKGIALLEVPLSYAFGYTLKGNTKVDFGINMKFIKGTTYYNILAIDTDSDTLSKSLKENTKSSSNFGIDLGALIKKDDLKIGIVGKYLNAPSFKFYDGSKYKISPMVRAGISYDVKDWLNLAMDIDLTENKTLIENYNSQYIGMGAEFKFEKYASLSLRTGIMRNLVEDDEGFIPTLGLGVGLKWFRIDAAAAASTKQGDFNGDKIPRYFKLNIAITSNWG